MARSRLPEGYVLHVYGDACYVEHAVASVLTLRRHDDARPVALYCTEAQKALLARHHLDMLFERVEVLPEAHRSIIGFKHHLYRFKPYARTLYVDADMVWCRDPTPLWQSLAAHPFTATGLERADAFFGAPKGWGVLVDWFLDRRNRTLRRFGLTHLPRVQAGMIYAADDETTRAVCELAQTFHARRNETHFRSRLQEGRTEESCEWSLAMAFSRMRLPVVPWLQGYTSPQLDFVEGFVQHDADFEHVLVRYYADRFMFSLRGIQSLTMRGLAHTVVGRLPGRGDYMDVTPFVLHFGWKRHKAPFHAFSGRTWRRLTKASGDGVAVAPELTRLAVAV
jgi:hypothetical protein